MTIKEKYGEMSEEAANEVIRNLISLDSNIKVGDIVEFANKRAVAAKKEREDEEKAVLLDLNGKYFLFNYEGDLHIAMHIEEVIIDHKYGGIQGYVKGPRYILSKGEVRKNMMKGKEPDDMWGTRGEIERREITQEQFGAIVAQHSAAVAAFNL